MLANTMGFGLAAALPAASRAANGNTAALIGDWLTPFVAARDFSGLVAVAPDGGVPSFVALGHADFASRAPLTRSDRFGVESVSKLFTVEGLKALDREGKLGLDDPLSRWLPTYPGAKEITLRLLAQHRGGLARDLTDFESQWAIPHRLSDLVERCARIPPAGKPGGDVFYSNNGYRVLARVMELAAGAPYGEVVRRTVLAPRGMTDTGEWSLGDRVPHLAHGATPGADWRSLRRPAPCDMTNLRGAASYYSTVDDLLRFAASRQPAETGSLKPRTSDGHDGRGHGFVALCYRYPVERISIVVLGNVESGLFDSLKSGIETIVFDGAVPKLRPPPQSPQIAQVSPDFPGAYDLFGSRLVISRDTSGTWLIDAGDGAQPAIAVAVDKLFFRMRYATITLVRSADGVKLAWSEPSGAFELRKLA